MYSLHVCGVDVCVCVGGGTERAGGWVERGGTGWGLSGEAFRMREDACVEECSPFVLAIARGPL